MCRLIRWKEEIEMTQVSVFVLGLAVTFVATLVVVVYLQGYLRAVLVDLCGTVERANFWTAYSNVTLLLTPLIFAMHFRPEAAAMQPVAFALSAQVEAALAGLVFSIIVLGFVLKAFIPRGPSTGDLTAAGDQQHR
jgi:hypothetical protein